MQYSLGNLFAEGIKIIPIFRVAESRMKFLILCSNRLLDFKNN